MRKFYIALEEDGVPKFSSSPVAHSTRSEAETEGQRLAEAHPGETFGLYIRGVAGLSTFRVKPTPKVKTYKGSELFATAPEGTYQPAALFYARCRAMVLVNVPDRSVLFLGSTGDISPLCRSSWSDDEFIKVAEDITLTASRR